ncbi:MAG: 5-(carboxyamino)imidazole ribonucleotide synthase [Phycisphaerae bacterium]|nr:5-(carboxyamino)imidazole ribonucleotide synthase [Phycisphaerae bacterium]
MNGPNESKLTLGILGGGQLGWMLGVAARRLGIECVFLDPADRCPSDMVGRRIKTAFDDPSGLDRLADQVDVVTYEFENVPASAAARLVDRLPVRPSPRSLEVAQDRLTEKNFIADLGVPVPRFAAIGHPDDLGPALQQVGRPAILKTRRGGYDGKGQARIAVADDAAARLAELEGAPAIAESMVPFELEASVLVVRGVDGRAETWTPVRNEHVGGILRRSDAPGHGISSSAATAMRRHAVEIANALQHVGVLAVEFFVLEEMVLVNEIAPRVHNSGHLTIEHAVTSQFENHVRAVCGLPLGSTEPRFPTATMLNAIGDRPSQAQLDAISVPTIDELGDEPTPITTGAARWHDYRKTARPGRKIGHLTLVADTIDEDRILKLSALVPASGG